MVCACIRVDLVVCRGRFVFSTHIRFALMVPMILFHSILEVVRSDVLVVISPG